MKPFGVKQIPFILFAVLPIFSCGDSIFSDRSDDGAISVVCTTPAEPVAKPAGTTIRADLSVSDAAGALLAASALSMNGLTASGKVKVKNGTGYRVDIKGYDSLNNLTYYGSASNVTVESGKTTTVAVTLIKAEAATVTIWGFVFGADGITVTLSGDSTGSKTLNNGDQYSFSVPSGGSYTVTPIKEGYTFTPDTFTFMNISSSQQRNFSGSKITLTLSGTVTGADSVVVALTGDAGSSQMVNSGGLYSFTVTYGGNYTVTPLKTGYEFTPESKSFTNVRVNQTQDFTATKQTFTISSTVSGADEVTVTLSGNATATQMVNSGGTYSFTVAYGGDYTVTPSKTGYVFVPANKNFTNVTANQTQNFEGSKILYILSGVVTGADGVTVTLSGDSSATQTVNDGGTYSFSIAYGGTYTVTPSKDGYVFTPANKLFTNVMANQTQNFTGFKNNDGSIHIDIPWPE